LQKRILSLVATTTADVASTSIVSIIIISYTLFPFLSFFFFILVIVVLAATTTRFSFFSFFSISFFSVYTSVVSYQQIHCSTGWLVTRTMNEHFASLYGKRERERGKKKATTGRSLPVTKARSS
jgi:hypothetical protein